MPTFKCEVSISELLYYRNQEGLTNKEIAKRLGVSYQTVLKAIGPEPKQQNKPKEGQ